MKQLRFLFLLATCSSLAVVAHAADATAPRGTTRSIYDSGFALVGDVRTHVRRVEHDGQHRRHL